MPTIDSGTVPEHSDIIMTIKCILVFFVFSFILVGCGETASNKAPEIRQPIYTRAHRYEESPSERWIVLFTHDKSDTTDDHVEIVDRFWHRHQDIILHREINDETRLISVHWSKTEWAFQLNFSVYHNYYSRYDSPEKTPQVIHRSVVFKRDNQNIWAIAQ